MTKPVLIPLSDLSAADIRELHRIIDDDYNGSAPALRAHRPIIVRENADDYSILDGYHRAACALSEEREWILAVIATPSELASYVGCEFGEQAAQVWADSVLEAHGCR